MLDLERIREKWLRECGVHDAGLVGMVCSCPVEDYRHVMLDLVEELERQRELLAYTHIKRRTLGSDVPLPVAAPDPAATVRRRPDGNAECAFRPDDCPTYTGGTCDGGCTPDPAVELPGMWEDADLTGGQTDAEPVPADGAGAGDGEQDATTGGAA